MLLPEAGNLAQRLAELGDTSTTLYLESIRSARLQVRMESQEETSNLLIRVVKLFFDFPDLPVLYCKSQLSKENLTSEEYASLTDGALPIGIIFHRYNDIPLIKKTNITVTCDIDPQLAWQLNVRSPMIFKKSYHYWVGYRNIGYITEYFNDESLQRI